MCRALARRGRVKDQGGPGPEEGTMNIQPVLDRMYADHVIYCIQPWCVRGGQLTRAQLFIGLNEQPMVPSCCACAGAYQSRTTEPLELWYIDDDLRLRWWEAIDGAISGGQAPPPPPPAPAAVPDPIPAGRPRSIRGWVIAGICALASIIVGMAMLAHASAIHDSGVHGWGLFFLDTPFVIAGLGVIGYLFIRMIVAVSAHDHRQAQQSATGYRAWKAGLSPEDQRKVWWAETAAI
jgi:hypothetical protein